jgi:hypothetical protein
MLGGRCTHLPRDVGVGRGACSCAAGLKNQDTRIMGVLLTGTRDRNFQQCVDSDVFTAMRRKPFPAAVPSPRFTTEFSSRRLKRSATSTCLVSRLTKIYYQL